jgi:PPP family 3-phenylpropionic acid transporter
MRLGVFYFLFFAQVGAYVAYFPLYLAARGLSAAEIAWVLALPAMARVFAPALWGWVADRSGAQRGIVALSCAVSALAFAAMPFVDAIAWLVGAMSLFSAAALPLIEAITLASLAGQAGPQLGTQLGNYGPIRLWGSISFLAVVLAGGAWLDRYPVTLLTVPMAVFMALACVTALSLPSGRAQASAQPVPLRLTPAVAALLGAAFCNAIAHGVLYAFLSLHLEALGYSGAMMGVLWTIGVAAEIVVFFYLPQLFRRYALSAILVASLACAVVRFLAIGWAAHELWIVLLAQLLHAATFGSFHAASVAAAYRIFPAGAQARGQTLLSSIGYGAGAAVGTVVAGWAWEAGGAPLAFTVAALAALVGAFIALRLKRAGL